MCQICAAWTEADSGMCEQGALLDQACRLSICGLLSSCGKYALPGLEQTLACVNRVLC